MAVLEKSDRLDGAEYGAWRELSNLPASITMSGFLPVNQLLTPKLT